MKIIYNLITTLLFSANAIAANLTASSTPAGFGKKDGKISLAITGGFAPYIISWTGPSGYTSSKTNPDSLAAGTYCVNVTDQYCGVATLCVVISEKTNGITELAESKTRIYPNPFLNQISIELEPSVTGKINLSLFDLSGKIISRKETPAENLIQWNIGDILPAGVYIIRIEGENGFSFQQKLNNAGQ